MTTAPAARPRRRDAERNRLRVLSAAREVFSRRGTTASLDEVATAAELGVGTVHRAFGSRAALVEAMFATELDEVAAFIDECAAEPSGWDALCRLLWGLVELQVRNRGLHDMVFGSVDEAANRVRERIEPAIGAVIERARDEGRVRPDLSAADVAMFSRAVAAGRADASDASLQAARRHVELLLKGLAATPDERPVPPPPAAGEPWQVSGIAPSSRRP